MKRGLFGLYLIASRKYSHQLKVVKTSIGYNRLTLNKVNLRIVRPYIPNSQRSHRQT